MAEKIGHGIKTGTSDPHVLFLYTCYELNRLPVARAEGRPLHQNYRRKDRPRSASRSGPLQRRRYPRVAQFIPVIGKPLSKAMDGAATVENKVYRLDPRQAREKA